MAVSVLWGSISWASLKRRAHPGFWKLPKIAFMIAGQRSKDILAAWANRGLEVEPDLFLCLAHQLLVCVEFMHVMARRPC